MKGNGWEIRREGERGGDILDRRLKRSYLPVDEITKFAS